MAYRGSARLVPGMCFGDNSCRSARAEALSYLGELVDETLAGGVL